VLLARLQSPVSYARHPSAPLRLSAAVLLLALVAPPANALHRDTPPAARITGGDPHFHPGTRSWSKYLAFSSTEDLTRTGSTGRQVYLFNLHAYDCLVGSTTETSCPSPPQPYLRQITSGAGAPDNPTVDETGSFVAFEADGTFNGGTGPASARRQIFIADLTTDPITYTSITGGVPGAETGDSLRPSFSSTAAIMVFDSTAALNGGPSGVPQVFVYRRLPGLLTRITAGAGPSQAPMLTADGSRLAFESTTQLDADGNGPDTGVWQIYLYDRNTQVVGPRLKVVTQGNGSSRHPYMAEKRQLLFFESSATDLPGADSSGPIGTQIYAADHSVFPPVFTRVTTPGPGESCNSTFPAVAPTVDRVAFISTCNLLSNATSGSRLFVRRFEKTQGGTLALETLYQITGRAEVFGPVGHSLGQWMVSLSTTDDVTGTGICTPQLHIVDYFDNPVRWPAGKLPGGPPAPVEPAPGNPDGGCEEGDPCTNDVCSAGNCQHNPKGNGAACAADACHEAGTCQQGECVGVSKCDDQNACTIESCDPFAGCSSEAIEGCVPCSNVSQCPDDGDACTTNSCTGGQCTYTPKQDGDDCSSPCRLGDICTSGVCGGGQPKCNDGDPCTTNVCDQASGACTFPLETGCKPCVSVAQCQDGNVCTNKQCIAGFCDVTPANPGQLCADNNPCDGGEQCNAQGACVETTPPPSCTPLDACHTGTCDPLVPGNCRFDPIPGCVPCTQASQCADGNPCTKDLCVGVPGRCQNPLENNNFPCSDGDLCNGLERCQNGFCLSGNPPDCDDHLACTNDFCEPSQGCVHLAESFVCDDGNLCTTDLCSMALGCLNNSNSNPCDDGNRCTGNDTCSGGACGGAPLVTDDANPCTDDSCTPAQGVAHTPKPDGARCGVGDGCTRFPTCLSGVCVGDDGPGTCTDGDACTLDTCTPAGCQHVQEPGFSGIFCRLAELEDLMSSPPLKRSLSDLVARAGRRLAKAESIGVRPARRQLRFADGYLRKFISRLIRGDGNVPRPRATELASKARDVLDPVRTLRKEYATLRTR
jgi:Tol biopolymer transport system component